MPRRSAAPDPIVTTLCDFLGAAVHQILHTRGVYPSQVFERRRLFDVTVFRSRYKELNDHIDLVVDGARQLIERDECDALIVFVLGAPSPFSRC